MFALLRVVPVVPVMPVVEVVADSREGVADRASDQGAEGSADQTPCHASAAGLISGGGGTEGRARAEADQRAEWR